MSITKKQLISVLPEPIVGTICFDTNLYDDIIIENMKDIVKYMIKNRSNNKIQVLHYGYDEILKDTVLQLKTVNEILNDDDGVDIYAREYGFIIDSDIHVSSLPITTFNLLNTSVKLKN